MIYFLIPIRILILVLILFLKNEILVYWSVVQFFVIYVHFRPVTLLMAEFTFSFLCNHSYNIDIFSCYFWCFIRIKVVQFAKWARICDFGCGWGFFLTRFAQICFNCPPVFNWIDCRGPFLVILMLHMLWHSSFYKMGDDWVILMCLMHLEFDLCYRIHCFPSSSLFIVSNHGIYMEVNNPFLCAIHARHPCGNPWDVTLLFCPCCPYWFVSTFLLSSIFLSSMFWLTIC